ncbi:MAG TPA: RluA family pseudouridine synthase [Kofleriaceae bacterium]|nr:RluA family pseudouridine synthase [Kofleriaceae bacterium]
MDVRRFVFEAAGDDLRPRLDQFLIDAGLELTRSQLKRLIEEGDVRIGGAPVKASRKLRPGDEIEVWLRPATEARAEPQAMDLVVLFEDAHLIVIDKPAGLVVHPAPGHPDGTLVNALLAHCTDLSGVGGELRPGIVHRLDKDTTGVMVATKDDETHNALARAFSDRDLLREYVAVVAPAPRLATGRFDTLYGRHPVHRKKFSSKVERGKRAVTNYRVEESFGGGRAAQVRCRLETGRTHQIRVHFADADTPVFGDPVYGRKPRDPALAPLAAALGRQALHAATLEITHPITGALLRFASEPPADMQALLAALRVLQPAP